MCIQLSKYFVLYRDLCFCIGTSVIAELKNERNVLYIERCSLNFIHSKIRATRGLSNVSKETERITEDNDNLATIDE